MRLSEGLATSMVKNIGLERPHPLLTRYGMSLWTCAGSTQRVTGLPASNDRSCCLHAYTSAGWEAHPRALQTWVHSVTLVSGA